jgi:hypothetical protein
MVIAINGLDSRKEDLSESFSAVLPFGIGYIAVDAPGRASSHPPALLRPYVVARLITLLQPPWMKQSGISRALGRVVWYQDGYPEKAAKAVSNRRRFTMFQKELC